MPGRMGLWAVTIATIFVKWKVHTHNSDSILMNSSGARLMDQHFAHHEVVVKPPKLGWEMKTHRSTKFCAGVVSFAQANKRSQVQRNTGSSVSVSSQANFSQYFQIKF